MPSISMTLVSKYLVYLFLGFLAFSQLGDSSVVDAQHFHDFAARNSAFGLKSQTKKPNTLVKAPKTTVSKTQHWPSRKTLTAPGSTKSAVAKSCPAKKLQSRTISPDWVTVNWFTNAKFPAQKECGDNNDVWTGISLCARNARLTAIFTAEAAYKSMTKQSRNEINFAASLCIEKVACYTGSIPGRHQKSTDFVRTEMSKVEEWKTAFTGSSGPGARGVLHAEDLALALMTEENRFNGQVAYMAVYGRYNAADRPAGVRWPCTVSSKFRSALCTKVLTALEISFDFKPEH
ncbi:hypothetical protein B0O99DRAFT_602140 [Bisporella sp. PMI_857]|nr:hypothetical protein B0O99DRAFT_602140 [Bisporella sp. PMI_857]